MYKRRSILPSAVRKSKPRLYQRRCCPYQGCSKVVSRLDNHLRQTHRIKDNVVFKKLMVTSYCEMSDVPIEPVSDSSSTEDEIREFKNFLRSHGLKEIRSKLNRGSSDDEEDPDWLTVTAITINQKREEIKNGALSSFGNEVNSPPIEADKNGTSEELNNKLPEQIENVSTSLNGVTEKELQEDGCESCDSGDDEDEELSIVMTPKKVDSLIGKFESWMMSVDGCHTNNRSAGQRSRQVLLILKAISPDEFNVNLLFDRTSLRKDWLNSFTINRKPGNARTYLNSQIAKSTEDCHKICTIIQNWSASFKDKVNVRKFEKQVDDLNKLLSPEELLQFDNSDLLQECQSLLKFHKASPKLPLLKTFTSCRDFILTSLTLSNATRPGALQNMTLGEFHHAKLEDNVCMVYVMKHKTASTSGPVVLAFSTSLYNDCRVYIDKIRNKIPGVGVEPSDLVFISWSGRQMTSSMIGDQFNAFFQRATTKNLLERNKRKLTATLVRKSFVSTVHSSVPGLKRDLSNMMCHSEDTAAKSYFLQEKTKNVAQTFKRMHSAMRSSSSSMSSEEIERKITEIFKDVLSSDATITLSSVREKNDLSVNIPLTEYQIRDKLRYIVENQKLSRRGNQTLNNEKDVLPPTDELGPPEDSDSSAHDDHSKYEFSAECRSRTLYLPKEEIAIRKAFKEIIRHPTSFVRRSAVERILKNDRNLKEIYEKHGLQKILVKVRTERRKYCCKK